MKAFYRFKKASTRAQSPVKTTSGKFIVRNTLRKSGKSRSGTSRRSFPESFRRLRIFNFWSNSGHGAPLDD